MKRILFLTVTAIFLSHSIESFAESGDPLIPSTRLTKNPVQIWAEEVAKAESSIQVAVYKFSSASARDALIGAMERGVKIDVIVDGKTAQAKNSKVANLTEAGMTVKLWPTERLGELHVKLTIIDFKTIITGSFNLSEAAEEVNTEIISIDRRAESIADMETIWRQLHDSLVGASTSGQGN